MSSTQSPILSGPTNVGIHNSSTAHKSWRHSLYFRMIRAWWLGEIEFQRCLVWFVISKGYGIEVSLQWIKMEIERQYNELGGRWGVPPGIEEWLMLCARWARGVLTVMEECRMKLMGANPGQGALTRIEERLCSGAAHPGWAARKGEGGKESEM